MATTVAPPRTRVTAGRIVFRIVAGLLVLALLAAFGVGAWFYRATHAPLAQLDGTIVLPGLSAPRSVGRDTHGVPHSPAPSWDDLVLVHRYVRAPDRL